MSAVSAGTTGIATGAPGSSRTSPPTFSAVSQLLSKIFPDAMTPQGEAPLEFSDSDMRPPRMIDAKIIEGHAMRAHRVVDPPEVGFVAFLDGIQESKIAAYLSNGVPIVFGTVAAAIRERRNRRMFTWTRAVEPRLYVFKSRIGASWSDVCATGIEVRDIDDDEASQGSVEHPFVLRDIARRRVDGDREDLEHAMAIDWCLTESRPILIDGPIGRAEIVARSPYAVGVIKSHRSLYVSGEVARVVYGLAVAERSSVFLSESKWTPVASFYLRIRDPRGHDPLWGLVRVETSAEGSDVSARADQVSRWILAEASPVALPDARWDKMVYGIRDCEEFLRAIR